jgi:DNA polymerase III subunit epsilon
MAESLKDLPVLVVDCQATGANPERGHLLEIGWGAIRGVDFRKPSRKNFSSCLLRIPETTGIPRKVQQITGIVPEDLSDAVSPRKAWTRLCRKAEKITLSNRCCPAVIHFSRYEKPFLEKLHRQTFPGKPFPLDIICTHEMVRRLFPGLPRKGLRAVAGYFGHTVPEKRRSLDHAVATGIIWQNCVATLGESSDIRTYEALSGWLEHKPIIGGGDRSYPMDRSIRLGLPDEPGIYRMRRSNKDILYIGKAQSLKHRVNSYFQKHRKHPEHTLEMLTQAKDMDVTVTGSALEAAVMESDEIKTLKPQYNIALRERGRAARFCSRDFSRVSETPDTLCCLGPVTSAEVVNALYIIAGLVARTRNDVADSETVARALSLPVEYAPDADIFNDGFQVFCSRHGSFLKGRSLRSALLRLGANFWQQRQVEKEATQNETGDPATAQQLQEPVQERVWTPDAVSDAVERCIERGAHYFRRARWFLLLSEARVAWYGRNPAEAEKHMALFDRGQLRRIGTMAVDDPLPVPSGFRRNHKERLQSFDLITYDRMRVVTTEIRRLVSEGRDVEIRLTETAFMRREALGKILRWV